MISKSEIKYLNSLKLKKHRVKCEQFTAEGIKTIDRLIDSSFEIEKIYATKDSIHKYQEALPLRCIEVNANELKQISNFTTPQDVIALVKQKNFETVHKTIQSNYSLVLDNIQDPGNMGTIIRIADWYNIPYIFCSNNCVDLYNPKVIQSTMGSIAGPKIISIDLVELFNTYKDLMIYGATLKGENIHRIEPTNGFIIIGNESKGISPEIYPFIKQEISIPGNNPKIDSLNAAISTGIICDTFLNNI